MKTIYFSLSLVLCTLSIHVNVNSQNILTGKTEHITDFPSAFVAARNIDIWLPAGYTATKSYAVLYMHDGQMLFDSTSTWNRQEWHVDEVMNELTGAGKIRDCVVVGIWNNGEYRHSEYYPQKSLDHLPASLKTRVINEQLMGKARADNYLKFIVKELKPFIDSHYATLPGEQNTFIMGSSMGSLISLYALCEYPMVFGGAACLSTHWVMEKPGYPGIINDVSIPESFRKYLRKKLPAPGNKKIYFDYGTATLDSLYKPHQILADAIMEKKGYTSENWITREFAGEDHSENAWSRRVHIPIEFLLCK